MVSINVKNIKGVEQSFAKYGKEANEEFIKITRFQADETENTAKQLAPKNNGTLAQSIHTLESDKGLTQNVGTNEPYAPYMEFGTGVQVSVPPEFKDMANRAKGKGGSFKEGLEDIKRWCTRKGIDVKLAYIIFVSILNRGLTPRPFMYPAFVKARATFADDIKDALKRLNKQYNSGNI